MKSMFKRMSVLVMAFVMTICMSLTAFAAGELEDVVSKLEGYEESTNTGEKGAYDDAVSVWGGLTDSPEGELAITFAGVTKKFTNNTTDAASGSADSNYITAYTAMNKCLSQVGGSATDSKTVSGTKAELQGMTDTLKLGADVNNGAQALSTVAPLIQQLTGILVIVILLAMAVFTAFDVAYLVLPVAKEKMDSAARSGNAAVSKSNASTGEAKFRFITDDAIQAYQTGTESGSNPLFIYLKKRVISYIALAIVVYILMSGNLAVIVNFILTMLESLFGMFGNLTNG